MPKKKFDSYWTFRCRKNICIKNLEDSGFEAIEIIPTSLLVNILEANIKTNLAVGIDIRSRDFDAKKISQLIKKKKEKS